MDSSTNLLEESRGLFARARETLSAMSTQQGEQVQTTTQTQEKRMSTFNSESSSSTPQINELTPQVAGQLYNEGKTVIEVARQYGTTYSKVRKLLATAGVEIRNPSARLKGRVRTKVSE
jgi:hypothetical protein